MVKAGELENAAESPLLPLDQAVKGEGGKWVASREWVLLYLLALAEANGGSERL